jgi:crotonobetainyl-CoA:carnitine CoA-transferase CaiB-like acyl-CoA transferase
MTAEDLYGDPHLRARGFLCAIAHPEAGEHEYFGLPWSAAAREMPRRPAPCFGEHNREVLGRILGYPEGRIQELERAGVLASSPAPAWDGTW